MTPASRLALAIAAARERQATPAQDLARAFAERHRDRLAHAHEARSPVASRWRIREGEGWRRARDDDVLILVADFAREASEGAPPHVFTKMRSLPYARRVERHARRALAADTRSVRPDPGPSPHLLPRGLDRPA